MNIKIKLKHVLKTGLVKKDTDEEEIEEPTGATVIPGATEEDEKERTKR